MLNRPGHDFSFSGLKTAVMIEVRKAGERGELDDRRADIAASFHRAAVDTLVAKSIRAAKSARLSRIVVAGGVGANKLLRQDMAQRFPGEVFYPRLAYCTDNGAMIAVAGALLLTPGFVTDAIGFVLLTPPSRAVREGGILQPGLIGRESLRGSRRPTSGRGPGRGRATSTR